MLTTADGTEATHLGEPPQGLDATEKSLSHVLGSECSHYVPPSAADDPHGRVLSVSPQEVARLGLPPDTAAVAVWEDDDPARGGADVRALDRSETDRLA